MGDGASKKVFRAVAVPLDGEPLKGKRKPAAKREIQEKGGKSSAGVNG